MINPASSSPLRTQPGAARVVAIGSSAGSLHALGQFFASATGTWSDTAFVVVVHLPPDFESHLAELLAQSTSLAVSAIEDNAPIRGGHVYVTTGNVLDMARENLRLKLRIALRRAGENGSATPVSEIVTNGDAAPIKITVTQPFDTAHSGQALLVIFARVPMIDRPVVPAPTGVDSDLWHLESELQSRRSGSK